MARPSGWRDAVVAALFALALGVAAPAPAQTPPSPPGDERTERPLEELVRTLEDEGERKRLVEQIRGLIEARRAAEPEEPALVDQAAQQLIDHVARHFEVLGERFVVAWRAFERVPQSLDTMVELVRDPARRDRLLAAFFDLFVVLSLGLLAEFLAGRVLGRWRLRLDATQPLSVAGRLAAALGRAVLLAVPLVAFAATASLVLTALGADILVARAAVAFVSAYVLARAVGILGRVVLAPLTPSARLVPAGDETAAYLLVWTRRFAGLGFYGYFGVEAAWSLGLPYALYIVAHKLVFLALAALAVVFILQNRQHVADALRHIAGDGERRIVPHFFDPLRRRLAGVWHVLAVLYVAVAYVIWVLEIEGGFEFILRATVRTAVVALLALLAAHLLRGGIARGFRVSAELRDSFPLLEGRANLYLPLLHRLANLLVGLAALFAVLDAWGVPMFEWLSTPVGRRLLSGAASILVAFLVAAIVWELVNAWVERYLARIAASGQATAHSARLKTFLPLLRNVAYVAIIVVVALVTLSELGLNIAPLLAGAGVVGLAIGFGSQALVKDVITGLFILLEDTINVGDVVKVGGRSGVVEAITIRTIRLRDLSGAVHTIPFSVVDAVENMTKVYSHYVADVGVSYREDVDEVMQVLREIDEGLRADPKYGPNILEPMTIMGVDKLADSAVIIRCRLKTLPVKQWDTGRELLRRIKKTFDERGIEIPFPHQTIYFGEDKTGEAPPIRIRRADRKPEARGEPAPPALPPPEPGPRGD